MTMVVTLVTADRAGQIHTHGKLDGASQENSELWLLSSPFREDATSAPSRHTRPGLTPDKRTRSWVSDEETLVRNQSVVAFTMA